MRIKRCFTLLEVALAVSVLVLVASVVGVNVKKLVDRHRFESQIADLFVSLQEAQVLSATYQTDFSLDIEQRKEDVIYRFSTDEPFLDKQFSQRSRQLPTGVQVRWQGRRISHLHVDLYAGGRVEPAGVLSFAQTKEENANMVYIDLQYVYLMKLCYTQPVTKKAATGLQKPIRI